MMPFSCSASCEIDFPHSFSWLLCYEKQPIRGLGLTENEIFHTSEPSDEQKSPKTTFPRPRMSRNRQKQPFRPLGRIKNTIFHASDPSDEWKIAKNCVSGHPDGRKTTKTAFRGTPTSRKREKPAVVGRRNAKNDESYLSSADDR